MTAWTVSLRRSRPSRPCTRRSSDGRLLRSLIWAAVPAASRACRSPNASPRRRSPATSGPRSRSRTGSSAPEPPAGVDPPDGPSEPKNRPRGLRCECWPRRRVSPLLAGSHTDGRHHGHGRHLRLSDYVGELFGISKEDQPFLSAIGGLTGGVPATAKRFEWEYYDLRTPAVRVDLEGADAPTAEARVRANASNVLQIVHEAVDISYTKIAARGQLHADALVEGSNPVDNEFDWQVALALKQCARDINYSFINGTYAEPADNSTERKTRGLLEAIATNAVALVDAAVGGDITGVASTDLITSASAHGLTVGDRVEFTTLNGGAATPPPRRTSSRRSRARPRSSSRPPAAAPSSTSRPTSRPAPS